MKQHVMAVLWMMIICISSGCARSLPPHEELNQVFKKSFDATGMNYSSKTRITNISVPKQDGQESSDNKGLKYLDSSLDILRGFSVNADGAIDMKAKKSEILYDLHYNRDNVEVSIKFPLMVDYNTQTIYVGTSVLNTLLEVAYPQIPATRGKLIRINIHEFLKENAASIPELSNLINNNTFNPKSADSINKSVKASVLKSLAKLNDSCFSDQQLTEQDRKAGVSRRVRVNINHNDSVEVVVDLVRGIAQALFQDGVINKKEYDGLLALTDKKALDGLVDKFTLSMTVDVGVAQSGFAGYMETQLQITDKEKVYQLGLENISSFSDYNTPHFTLKPETSEIIDIKKIMDVISAEKAKTKAPDSPKPGADDSGAPAVVPDVPEGSS